jgi:uncharacterized membrane protein
MHSKKCQLNQSSTPHVSGTNQVGANPMSVQEVIRSTSPQAKSTKAQALVRLIVAQLIAVGVVVIAGWNFWADMFAWLGTQNLTLHAPNTSYLAKLPVHILVHIFAATTSIGLGAVVLYAPKGTRTHKLMGRVWMIAMVTTSLTSFFMESFAPMLGQFGPIHILSVWTLISMPRSILLARRGDIAGHMQVMKGTYWGLVIAGVMTFIPGRTMFAIFFG